MCIRDSLDEVQHIEKEAEIEEEARAPLGDLNDLSGDAAGIANEQEHLEKQAFALGRAGDDGLADGDWPGEAKAENRQCFEQICNHNLTNFLFIFYGSRAAV